jgi:hypothetical protein
MTILQTTVTINPFRIWISNLYKSRIPLEGSGPGPLSGDDEGRLRSCVTISWVLSLELLSSIPW